MCPNNNKGKVTDEINKIMRNIKNLQRENRTLESNENSNTNEINEPKRRVKQLQQKNKLEPKSKCK